MRVGNNTLHFVKTPIQAMSDILFDILQTGDEANGFEWHIEVNGPSALYVGDTFCINAETFSAIQISLVK